METKRAFTAVILSLIILVGYQYLFVPTAPPPSPEQPVSEQQAQPAAERAARGQQQETSLTAKQEPADLGAVPPPAAIAQGQTPARPAEPARDITVETSLYTAVISENGGVVKSFKLKKYKESLAQDSPPKELIQTKGALNLPLEFTWGDGGGRSVPFFKANRLHLATTKGGRQSLVMTAVMPSGLEIIRTMVFRDDSYLINLGVMVKNKSAGAMQGAPYLQLINKPFAVGNAKTSFLFNGPAAYLNGNLEEVKVKTLHKDGPQTFTGKLSWAAYEGTYFICGVMPEKAARNTVRISLAGEDQVTTSIGGTLGIIPAGGVKKYSYGIYFGPKRLSTLKEIGSNLNKAINFGWFDMLAKPTLYLLNFLNRYVHNYGVAIILVTVLFKLLLWPVSQKGMKSMKTMQKIQPKMAKLREKYKDNKEKLNQEMMLLYKTYKINPLGGCLPMVVQIPVFFALYRVLLQTIELRHAPFMLWINDLSAPDRLQIGINIPYLHGIPVLTLLMGASMFLQQKMSPTSADPTQAKVMLFLPVVFTFMFLNFASGLVLYWFVNNLLSIGQQYYINKSID